MSKNTKDEMWVFKVPNTEEGNEFISLMKKFINKDRIKIRKKGRGSRADCAEKDGYSRRGYDAFLPIRHAEWFHIYFDDHIIDKCRKDYYRNEGSNFIKLREVERELSYNDNKIEKLTKKNDEYSKYIEELKNNISDLENDIELRNKVLVDKEKENMNLRDKLESVRKMIWDTMILLGVGR